MAALAAFEDAGGTLSDRDPLGNMDLLVSTAVAAVLTLPVRTYEAGDKMPLLRIDPLVDRLMADGMLRLSEFKPSGDKLGRPASLDVVFHVARMLSFLRR